MVRSFMSGFYVLLLVAGILYSPRFSSAQTILPRAGQNFSFGIIQGADYLVGDSIQSSQQSLLMLTVVSAYAGCGVVTSPSGYIQDFTFIPGAATVIDLPYNLLLLNDLGKTNKGLLVHTTEPVNLVLHDYILDAGDATQILPDNALDTSYVTFGWGIWDDPSDTIVTPGERNCDEFLITAASDSTLVTITPSINTMNGLLGGVPVTIQLDRGECYIVKADTSDHPSDPSLSGSKIHSTKPVSVISGLTCGYVPVGDQSCNELMDELIGKKWWGSHFFFQPMGNSDLGVELVLTSNRDFYAKLDNGFLTSTQGRIATIFSGTAEVRTFDLQGNPVQVEAHQLTRGSDFYDFFDFGNLVGDPTLVSVLDTQYYTDTLVWNTPLLPPENGQPFLHFVPIVVPTADLSRSTIDGTPLSLTGVPSSIINGSAFSAINPAISPGEHTIISPDPLFALVTGFNGGDSYSFMAGTTAPEPPRVNVSHAVLLQADSAPVCNDFIVNATFATPILSPENVISLTVPITYDPAALLLIGFQPGAILRNGNYTVDSSTPGYVTVTISGKPFITGSDLFQLLFQGSKSVGVTVVGNNATPSYCGDDSETLTIQPVTLTILPSVDSTHAVLTIHTSTVSLGTQAMADVSLSGLPASVSVLQFDLYLTYNHDVLTYDHADLNGTLTETWPPPTDTLGIATDTLHFTSPAALSSTPGLLAQLWFRTYVADSSYSPITVSGSFPGTNGNCPILYLTPDSSALFLGQKVCGDTLLEGFLLGQPIVLDRAELLDDGNLHVVIQLPIAANVNLSLTDILGRTLWTGILNGTAGTNDREFALPQNLPSGPVMLRASSTTLKDGQNIRSKELMLVK